MAFIMRCSRLGLNELCRVYFVTSKEFGAATGGLYGAQTYIPDDWSELGQLQLAYYASVALMVLALLLYRLVNGRRLGRILRMAPEKREAFAEATGVNFRQARVRVFIISSVALGFIGGFYSAHFGGVAFSIFSFDTVLLGLAMLVIGGIGRAEGAVVGTLVVVFFDKVLITLGPLRLILIGLIMLFVVLYLRNGLFGIKAQFRAGGTRRRASVAQRGQRRAARCCLRRPPRCAMLMRFIAAGLTRCSETTLRRSLRPEVIEEHRRDPQGQHSEALERLLIYFRGQPQSDKYAITIVEPFKAFRIVALSGHRGVAPRVVEDKIYTSQAEAYHSVFLRRVQDLLES